MAIRKVPGRIKYNLAAMKWLFFVVIAGLAFNLPVLAQNNSKKLEEKIQLIREVLEDIQKHYVDPEKADLDTMTEGALKGILQSLDDPFSAYLTEEDLMEIEEITTGKIGGVGIVIFKGEKWIEVSQPMEATPAYAAGVIAGDFIVAVDEESTEEMTLYEVVNRIRGTPGTSVTLTILRGESKTFDVTLERAVIEIPSVKREMIGDDIAYLKILEFSSVTYENVVKAIDFFDENSYSAMIIDLRNNPGGLRDSPIDIADLFLPKGKIIVSTKSRNAFEDRVYRAWREPTVTPDIPVVLLIDKYSASASEILVGALKDNERVYVMGEKSYGKGSIQAIRDAGKGGYRLTIAKYYTPSGVSIHGVGIEPDKVVKEEALTEEEEKSAAELFEEKSIETFVEKNSSPTEKQIDEFIKQLKKQGIVLRERYIKKLIRNQVNKANNNYPVYDLDFDIVLQEAVKYLKKKQ
ncbi:MAG: S41 family peptidase [Spirochaetales bacterium]|nr:S41 family peptidase [Spirochaetales bacterium]